MPYDSISDLPKGVVDNLPKHAQEIYLAAFNNAYEEYAHDEDRARRVAWSAVKKGGYAKDEATGKWKKIKRIKMPQKRHFYLGSRMLRPEFGPGKDPSTLMFVVRR